MHPFLSALNYGYDVSICSKFLPWLSQWWTGTGTGGRNNPLSPLNGFLSQYFITAKEMDGAPLLRDEQIDAGVLTTDGAGWHSPSPSASALTTDVRAEPTAGSIAPNMSLQTCSPWSLLALSPTHLLPCVGLFKKNLPNSQTSETSWKSTSFTVYSDLFPEIRTLPSPENRACTILVPCSFTISNCLDSSGPRPGSPTILSPFLKTLGTLCSSSWYRKRGRLLSVCIEVVWWPCSTSPGGEDSSSISGKAIWSKSGRVQVYCPKFLKLPHHY